MYEGNRTAFLKKELEKEAFLLPMILRGGGKALYHGAKGLDTAAKGIGKLLVNPENSKLLTKGLTSQNPYIKKTTEFATNQVLPRVAGGVVLAGGAIGAKSLYNSFQEGAQKAKANSTQNTGNFSNTGLGPQF